MVCKEASTSLNSSGQRVACCGLCGSSSRHCNSMCGFHACGPQPLQCRHKDKRGVVLQAQDQRRAFWQLQERLQNADDKAHRQYGEVR